jgi:hypothetical protein
LRGPSVLSVRCSWDPLALLVTLGLSLAALITTDSLCDLDTLFQFIGHGNRCRILPALGYEVRNGERNTAFGA